MKITWARADTWQALYVNGVLWSEDHSFDIDDVMAILEDKPNGEDVEYSSGEVDFDWFFDGPPAGSFPKDEEDIVWES